MTDTGPAPGRPRILVVDDEPAIRRFIALSLNALGAEIVEAGDGAEAIARIEEAPNSYGVLLCDLTLPGVDGAAVVRAARAARPDLPCYVMTGWSAVDASTSLGDVRIDGWLEKPFKPADLRAVVAAALARGSGTPPES